MTDTLHDNRQPSAVHCVSGPDGLAIELIGDIDISSWPRLDQVYSDIVAAPACDIRVDLTRASFVDSNTLGFLARVHQYVTDRGHTLVLDSPNRIVSRAIEVCGLDRVLTVRRDRP